MSEHASAQGVRITGSPTEEEVAAVLVTLLRNSGATESTGETQRQRAEASLRRWRTARSAPATYRGYSTWGRPN